MGNTYYLDPYNGDDLNDGLSFATRRRWLLPPIIEPGDEVRFVKSHSPVYGNNTATWTEGSPIVALIASHWEDLMAGTAVADSTNGVTYAFDALLTKTSASHRFVVPAAYGTGRIGYVGLLASVAGSGLTRVSFWLRNEVPLAAGQLRLNLCTDAAGTDVAASFDVHAIPGTHRWVPVVIEGPFPSTIGSWSLTVESAIGVDAAFNVDNLLAAQPQSSGGLTLYDLIGFSSSIDAYGSGTPDDTWYAMDSIVGTTVRLSTGPDGVPADQMPYRGQSRVSQLWVRLPLQMNALVASEGEVFYEPPSSGDDPLYVRFTGGWDDGTMQTQVGTTWFDGRDGRGLCFACSAQHHVEVSRFAMCRFWTGVLLSSSSRCRVDLRAGHACQSAAVRLSGACFANRVNVDHLLHNAGPGFTEHEAGSGTDFTSRFVWSNGQFGVELAHGNEATLGTVIGNRYAGIHAKGGCHVHDAHTSLNGSGAGASGAGLAAIYYDNKDFTGTTFQRVDPNVDFRWSGSPAPDIGQFEFSVRWVGKIRVSFTELYTFHLRHDDGVRMWVDGVKVIDKWVVTDPITTSGTPVSLVAGADYDVVIEFFQNFGTAVCELRWSSTSQSLGIVPASAFTTGAAGAAGNTGVWLSASASGRARINLHNCTVDEPTVVGGLTAYSDARVASHHHNRIKGNHIMWTDGAIAASESGADRRTASGFAWKMSPDAPRSADYPLLYPLCSLAVLPGQMVTVSGWMKRQSGLTEACLFVPGGQLDGVGETASPAITDVGTYQQVSLTFTPTEIGVVDVYARVYGGYGQPVWVDDMAAIQP